MTLLNLRTITGAELSPLAFAHPTPFDPSKVNPVVNREAHVKPSGGIWLSPHLGPAASEWTYWLDSEQGPSTLYGAQQLSVQKVVLDPEAELLLIDGRDDFEAILEHYTAANGRDFSDIPENLVSYLKAPIIDFEAVSESYAGIYLTDNGQWETRYGRDGRSLLDGPNLYGWDLESALVFSSDSIIYADDPVPHVYIPQEDEYAGDLFG